MALTAIIRGIILIIVAAGVQIYEGLRAKVNYR